MADPAAASPPDEPPPDLLAFIQGGPPTTPGNDDAAPTSTSLTSPSSLASPDPKQRLAEASAVLERASQAMAEASHRLRLLASAETAPWQAPPGGCSGGQPRSHTSSPGRHRLAAAAGGSLAPTHPAQRWQPRLERQGLRRGPPLLSGAQARAAAESANREAHGKREAMEAASWLHSEGRMEVASCQEVAENSRARAETARAAAERARLDARRAEEAEAGAAAVADTAEQELAEAQQAIEAKVATLMETTSAAEEAEVKVAEAVAAIEWAQVELAEAEKEAAAARELSQLFSKILADKSRVETELSLETVTSGIKGAVVLCRGQAR